MLKLFTLAAAVLISIGSAASAATAPPVKLSKSGICHSTSSAWYSRTKSFTSFDAIDACIASGGRYPKGYSPGTSAPQPPAHKVGQQDYDRDQHFGSWIDEDGDCFNTRHEILRELSTGPVTTQGCRVIHGRWNDPYTGNIYLESRLLDIDHMVPLKWAWEHGADKWSAEARKSFANDPRNLFAVEAGANRSKGASGPLDWLPPNRDYQCEYVLRFKRIALTWKLEMSGSERGALDRLQERLCTD